MAPESFAQKHFTHKTDVWALGVLFWEIFSDAELPYIGIVTTNLPTALMNGTRLEQPATCPRDWYGTMMLPCWTNDGIDRPTFTKIVQEMESLGENAADGEPSLRYLGEFLEAELSRIPIAEATSVLNEGVPLDCYGDPFPTDETFERSTISISASNPFAHSYENPLFEANDAVNGGGDNQRVATTVRDDAQLRFEDDEEFGCIEIGDPGSPARWYN
jgi:c-mer proto-oncogene tyrosine kinase